MTTIKVPVELRDRLAVIAHDRDTTLAGAIEYSLDTSEDAAFWEQVHSTMTPGDLSEEAEKYATALTDGLDAEDWSSLQ
jgi:predicted DNA-binding protein